MTTEPEIDDAAIAAKLYPHTPQVPEPAAQADDAEIAKLFYPKGPNPEPRARPATPTADGTGAEPSSSDEAHALYGDGQGHRRDTGGVGEVTQEAVGQGERETEADKRGQDDDDDTDARDDEEEKKNKFDEGDFDSEVLADYRSAAEELGIEDAAAQQLLERIAPRLAERQAEQGAALRQQWAEQARADPELDDYAGFDENIESARRVIRRFDSSGELRQFLNTSGFGDHPALIKFALRVARRLGRAL